jgi:hypothetical protein
MSWGSVLLYKGKVVSVYAPWRRIGGEELQIHSVLISALDEGELCTSRLGNYDHSQDHWLGRS